MIRIRHNPQTGGDGNVQGAPVRHTGGGALPPRRWLHLRRAVAVALTSTVLVATALAIATARDLKPLPGTLQLAADGADQLRFVDRNGVPLNRSYAAAWNFHDQLQLHEIPPFLRLAFIHAEDKRFHSHAGPDWLARASALATNLRYLDSIRGASTARRSGPGRCSTTHSSS